MNLTPEKCYARAEQLLAQAEREPRHRRKLTAAAQAWIRLAKAYELDLSVSNVAQLNVAQLNGPRLNGAKLNGAKPSATKPSGARRKSSKVRVAGKSKPKARRT